MQLSLPRIIDRGQRREARAIERSAPKSRAAAATRPMPDPAAEEFRLLAMNLMALLEDTPRKTVAIFSHGRGDGRTHVAVELSRALALQTDVLLVDGQPNSTGVYESWFITGPSSGVRQSQTDTGLIPANYRRLRLSDGSREASAKGDLANRMTEATAAGMVVVVDTPAAQSSSDAYMLAQGAKNVLYIMRSKPQDMAPHRRAMDHLRRLDTRILGIVINDR